MDLVLQLLGRHLRNGDAPMREFVNEFRAARPGDLECWSASNNTRGGRDKPGHDPAKMLAL